MIKRIVDWLLLWPSGWFFSILGLFVIANAYLITIEFYLLPLLPLLILLIYAALASIDKLIYFIAFFTPFSVVVEFSDFAALTLPTEPLIFGVMLVFLFKLVFEGGFDKKVTKHPVTIILIFYLFWMFVTALFSTMPAISLKYFVSRFWFVIAFYFVTTQIFKKFSNISFFLFIFTLPLCGVILYSIFGLYDSGLDKNALYWVMQPFFKDHTIYGAVIAMILPVMVVFAFDKSYSVHFRRYAFAAFMIIFIGIILSYTRAAWLSLFGAFLAYLVFVFKINWRLLFLGGMLFSIMIYANWDDIMLRFAQNKQSSSEDLVEHVQSISNIRSDASNKERINRWSSAIRMFEEKPYFGFGPGTYQFKYAPYQRSYEMTYVSTNTGSLGNAHSEYLGPMAESGLLGSLNMIALVIAVLLTGSKVYRNAYSPKVRRLAIGVLLGLITYFLHGFLNNFLDTDKASLPFWSMIAILVALNVYHMNEGKPQDKSESAG